MRGQVILTLVVLVSYCTLSEAIFYAKDCVLIDGICHIRCPPGMHSYAVGCALSTLSKPTCGEPVSRDMGPICDFADCHCDGDKVWDETRSICVDLADCPIPSGGAS